MLPQLTERLSVHPPMLIDPPVGLKISTNSSSSPPGPDVRNSLMTTWVETVGVGEGVKVAVKVGVKDTVGVGLAVGVRVSVGVNVSVGVRVSVGVSVTVGASDGVTVSVGVLLGVAV